ncbi:MAG: hypothetical protein IH859_09960 [Chloroflexi bacterium]|nr:hypothetical protein [Chloroflexota bacterium]
MEKETNEEYPNLEGINYYFIGGNGGNPPLVWFWRLVGAGENDGLIGKFSSIGWKYPNSGFYPADWPTASIPGQFWTDESHGGYYRPLDGDWSNAFRCIQDILDRFEIISIIESVCESAFQVEGVINATYQMTEVKADILSGQSESLILTIDSDFMQTDFRNQEQIIVFFVITDLDEFEFVLTNPENITIDSLRAQSLDGISYEYLGRSENSPPMAAYSFSATAINNLGIEIEGSWIIEILGDAGMSYQVFALLESDLTLSAVSPPELTYATRQRPTFSVKLANNGSGIDGATVRINCTHNKDDADDVIMDDNGGGIYEGTCELPEDPGFLIISIVATGPSGQFSRQLDFIVEVE